MEGTSVTILMSQACDKACVLTSDRNLLWSTLTTSCLFHYGGSIYIYTFSITVKFVVHRFIKQIYLYMSLFDVWWGYKLTNNIITYHH